MIEIVIGLLVGIAGGAGAIWLKWKPVISNAVDLLVTIRDAAEDDNVTEEEFQDIISKAKPIIAAMQTKFG